MRRSTPFDEFESLFERMSRQFDEMSRTWETPSAWRPGAMGSEMAVDVTAHDDEIVVTADLPGVEKSEIDVSVSRDLLTIRTERDVEEEREAPEYLRHERRQTSMRRTIRLPEEVDEESATATYRNGVLTVTLPRLDLEADEESRQIDVE
jgi:HSP20 family protein